MSVPPAGLILLQYLAVFSKLDSVQVEQRSAAASAESAKCAATGEGQISPVKTNAVEEKFVIHTSTYVRSFVQASGYTFLKNEMQSTYSAT